MIIPYTQESVTERLQFLKKILSLFLENLLLK